MCCHAEHLRLYRGRAFSRTPPSNAATLLHVEPSRSSPHLRTRLRISIALKHLLVAVQHLGGAGAPIAAIGFSSSLSRRYSRGWRTGSSSTAALKSRDAWRRLRRSVVAPSECPRRHAPETQRLDEPVRSPTNCFIRCRPPACRVALTACIERRTRSRGSALRRSASTPKRETRWHDAHRGGPPPPKSR